MSVASCLHTAYAAGAASVLWHGLSLLLVVLCCVRFISMPKPLRAHTDGSLFPPAKSPPSLKYLWLSAVCSLVCSAWLVWWQLASFRVGNRLWELTQRLWELTQRNSTSSWKCLCLQRVCVMLSVGHAVPPTAGAAVAWRLSWWGETSFPLREEECNLKGLEKEAFSEEALYETNRATAGLDHSHVMAGISRAAE